MCCFTTAENLCSKRNWFPKLPTYYMKSWKLCNFSPRSSAVCQGRLWSICSEVQNRRHVERISNFKVRRYLIQLVLILISKQSEWWTNGWVAGLRREVRINQRMLIAKEKFYQHHHYHHDTRTGSLIDCRNPLELLAFIWIDVKDSLNAKTTKAKFPLRLFVVKTARTHCFKVTRNYYSLKVHILSKLIQKKGKIMQF